MIHRLTCILLLITTESFCQVSALRPAFGRKGMVASSDSMATAVGVRIMEEGGNAVDAAVAVGFVLAVTYPQAGNLGGGGYYVIHLSGGENFAIDARETAPSGAFAGMFLDSSGNVVPGKSLVGGLSAGVPGNVDGLVTAETKFGRLSLEKVLAPAIAIADTGFRINKLLALGLDSALTLMSRYPSTVKYFTRDGRAYGEGDIMVQKDLAAVLRRISSGGRDGFYTGEIPEMIAREDRATGGVITAWDIENYHAIIREPTSFSYHGYQIIAMPPSSSGGICLEEMMNILGHFDLRKYGYGASQTIHYEVEAMRRAYADRDKFLGDAAFVRVPTEELTSTEYADSVAARIDSFKATPSSEIYPDLINPPREGTHTTHYSVVDGEGNAVSVTTTLNSWFGSMVAVDSAGFLLNNEMDDFSAKAGVPNQFGAIGGGANSIRAGKRMLSSMTPTIVLKDGKPFLVLGSPGGTTIINSVLDVILNVVDFEMPLVEAEIAGRIHHQWIPDDVRYENSALVYDVKMNLAARGYKLVPVKSIGEVQAILVTPSGLEGVADPRGVGTAQGY